MSNYWINHCQIAAQAADHFGSYDSAKARAAVLERAGQLAMLLQPGVTEVPSTGLHAVELMTVVALDEALSNAANALIARTNIDFESQVAVPTFDGITGRLQLPSVGGVRKRPVDAQGLLELAMERAEMIVTSVISGSPTSPNKNLAIELIGEEVAMEVLRRGARATAEDFDLNIQDLASQISQRHFSPEILERSLRNQKLDPGSLAQRMIARASHLLIDPTPRVLNVNYRVNPDGRIGIEVMGRHSRNRAAGQTTEKGAADAGTSAGALKDQASSGRVSSC